MLDFSKPGRHSRHIRTRREKIDTDGDAVERNALGMACIDEEARLSSMNDGCVTRMTVFISRSDRDLNSFRLDRFMRINWLSFSPSSDIFSLIGRLIERLWGKMVRYLSLLRSCKFYISILLPFCQVKKICNVVNGCLTRKWNEKSSIPTTTIFLYFIQTWNTF